MWCLCLEQQKTQFQSRSQQTNSKLNFSITVAIYLWQKAHTRNGDSWSKKSHVLREVDPCQIDNFFGHLLNALHRMFLQTINFQFWFDLTSPQLLIRGRIQQSVLELGTVLVWKWSKGPLRRWLHPLRDFLQGHLSLHIQKAEGPLKH